MLDERYSYNDIENDYTIESTITDFHNGIIIGKKHNEYYTFTKLIGTKHNVFSFNDRKAYSKSQITNKNYILTKISQHGTQFKL